MKKLLPFLMILGAIAVAKPGCAQERAKWSELDAFHDVMSKTFHPAEEGKLDPIRSKSAEMVSRAVAWKNSTAPAGYDKNAVKENLKELVKGSKKIDKLVKQNASDKELTEELSALHEVFHGIVEKCSEGEHM